MSLYETGVRPYLDNWLLEESKKVRNYGEFWSASSAGYCMRKLIFERLGVPPVAKEEDARKQRVFTAGHLFHAWYQNITKEAGISIAQELELEDDELKIRGHIDDLVLIDGKLILYDAKTQHSNAFTWQKGKPASWFHKMQVGTYMYMLRKQKYIHDVEIGGVRPEMAPDVSGLSEARILKISKDDLRMDENQILWSEELEQEVVNYWTTLNKYWAEKKIPSCTCHVHENGFLAKEAYNPYFYEGEPCSLKLLVKFKKEKANG